MTFVGLTRELHRDNLVLSFASIRVSARLFRRPTWPVAGQTNSLFFFSCSLLQLLSSPLMKTLCRRRRRRRVLCRQDDDVLITLLFPFEEFPIF